MKIDIQVQFDDDFLAGEGITRDMLEDAIYARLEGIEYDSEWLYLESNEVIHYLSIESPLFFIAFADF